MKQNELQARLESGLARFGSLPRRPMVVGALCGVFSGIALGIFAGPVGLALGIVFGVGAGFVAGMILAEEDDTATKRTRELDAIIGVTTGSMGGASVPPRAVGVDEEEAEPLPSREAWLAEWLTPPPPNVLG
jgi:hypothetical protein